MHSFTDILKKLEEAGTEQTRKTYKNHGASDNLYGVKFGDLRKIAKGIGNNTKLANELWGTKNIDAMSLAILIANPHDFDKEMLNEWVRDINYYPVADLFVSEIVLESGLAYNMGEKWYQDSSEFVGRCGFMVIAHMALKSDSVEDFCFLKHLEYIKSNIKKSANGKKEAMNSALINIGKRNHELKSIAISIADLIGPIEINHGKTSCYTADAIKVISNPELHDKFVK